MGQALSYCIPQRPTDNPLDPPKAGGNNAVDNDNDSEEWKEWDDEKPQTKSGALQLGAKFKATTTPQAASNTPNNNTPITNHTVNKTTVPSESVPSPQQNNSSPSISHNTPQNTPSNTVTSTTASPPPTTNNGTNAPKPSQHDDFFSDMAPKIVSAPLVAPIKPSRLHLELESMKSESKNLTENSNAWGDQAEQDIWQDEDEEEIEPVKTTDKKDNKNKAAKSENNKKEKPRLVVEKKAGTFDYFDDDR
eukprot:TRINITY_DN5731_c0_g1_i1.p1 TRINITY_DN5731_c0_g1~~TRINITY_DN5731_c0_g1_i1.p1  ORF type:complete len:249 (-),score=79.95 TRINITY_DN5731_c0_g1_i1:62-808(-)